MNKYQRGKIYKIWSPTSSDVYIGSTCETLTERLRKHKRELDCECREIINNNKVVYITLIEKYPCNSKTELHNREGHFQRCMPCINKRIAGRTRAEYYQENKDKLKEIQKQYYEENKDNILKKNQEYYEDHKESIRERQQQYYEDNNESLKNKDKSTTKKIEKKF
mgnify:FL=1